MWKVEDHHIKIAGGANAVVTMCAKWIVGIMVGKLMGVGAQDTSTTPFYDLVLLNNVSFPTVTILAVLIVTVNTIAAAAMSSLSVLRSAETGRRLRRQILENNDNDDDSMNAAAGGGGGNNGTATSSSADIGHTATDLVAKITLIEDYQAYDEHWIFFNWIRLVLCIVFTFVFTWYGGVIGLVMVLSSEVLGNVIEKVRLKSHEFIEENSNQVGHRLLDVVKNTVMIKIMGTTKEEGTALRELEELSDSYRVQDAKLRFLRDSAKTLLVAMVPPLIALATWPIVNGEDAEEALRAATSILVTVLLLDEGHKSLIYLSFVYDRQNAATEAQAFVDGYLGKTSSPTTGGTNNEMDEVTEILCEESSHSHGDKAQTTTAKATVKFATEKTFTRTESPGLEAITVRNVHLAYPGRNLQVLNGFAKAFKKGRIHALIGESGSGKSSLMKIIANLLRPQTGSMQTWEGMVVAYVSQEQKLFARTIRENVMYGGTRSNQHPISDEQIWKALEMANIAPFVRSLPNQLDEVLDEGESMVSGGQLQRLHLAHLFCTGQNADLVLLDECLSALDENSREVLLERLETFLEGKTALIITHHSEMLRICDEIHDMTKAKEEQGLIKTLQQGPSSRRLLQQSSARSVSLSSLTKQLSGRMHSSPAISGEKHLMSGDIPESIP